MSTAYSRLQMWCWIGLAVAMIHFLVSEGSYRLAEAGGPVFLYDVSDTLAWPAGRIYDSLEDTLIEGELSRIAEDRTLSGDLREEARRLLETRLEDEAWSDI